MDTARLMVESRLGPVPLPGVGQTGRSLSLSALLSTLAPLHVAHELDSSAASPSRTPAASGCRLRSGLGPGAPHSHAFVDAVDAGEHLSRRDAHQHQHLALGSRATSTERALLEVRRAAAAAAAATARHTMELGPRGTMGTASANAAAVGAVGSGTMAFASGLEHPHVLFSRTSPTRVGFGVGARASALAPEHKSHSRRAALARADVGALDDALRVRRAELVAVERERERALLELRELQAQPAPGAVRYSYSVL